jgi:adenine-specific DNA-methyltransferase
MAKGRRARVGRNTKKGTGNGKAAEKVKDYRHEEKRPNNPPAGLATYDKTLPSRKVYDYDPHLDPQLVWAGKAEHTSFEVENVALHIHERISTAAIVRAVQREPLQRDLFADPQLPLTQQIEFYQHPMNWANRLILGDSLLVMNSLLERELMAGKVQVIYMDPPYGVKFSSNFQPRIDRRDVKDSDDDLTREPEMIKAYRDTWTLGIHSYLTYLRDRLLLARELLTESGSIFVQISDENVHHVREVLDEVFGRENFVSLITFTKTTGFSGRTLSSVADYILWYARNSEVVKYRQLCRAKEPGDEGATKYKAVKDFSAIPEGRFDPERLVTLDQLTSQGSSATDQTFTYLGKKWQPPLGMHWKTTVEGMGRLGEAGRLVVEGNSLRYVRFLDDFPVFQISNIWDDVGGIQERTEGKLYVVQTATLAVLRCLLMTTDPGDLVLDPTCGSGTTAYVAEQWGRRWITCDTSRVALALARQRLMTATFPYYKLAHPVGEHLYGAPAGGPRGPSPTSGVAGGFIYKTVPHITLRSIAQNEPPEPETLYDQPEIDRAKVRVSGPFTVEAIPVPAMESVGEPSGLPVGGPSPPLPPEARADDIARRGRGEGRIANPAADHVTTMIELLRKAGVVFPGGKKLMLENLRPLGVGWLHAEAETVAAMSSSPVGGGDAAATARGTAVGDRRYRVAVSFGPRHGPVTAMQTHEAAQTASVNAYDVLILAGFATDPEAQAFIQKNPVKNLTIHFANVNPDVLVGDLLKTSRASQLFTVFGSPDVVVRRSAGLQPGKGAGLKASATEGEWYVVELLGVDIYDPNTGELHQSRGEDVGAWFLDQDYDGATFCISQAFFPSDSGAWEKLERALKGSLDPEKFEALRGTVSLPFQPGKYKRVAVKVIDMRGNEVIRVVTL